MKILSKTLQNPIMRIFISPLASILFGFIIGINNANSIQWLSIILLIIIVIFSNLVNHLFFIKYDKLTPEAAPLFLLYFFEAIVIIASIIFMFNSHWIISLLLIFYIVFIHIQYFPFKITGTIYHLILTIFFNGFILNIIAYNSQTYTVTTELLIALIPIVLQYISLTLQEHVLRQYISSNMVSFRFPYQQFFILATSISALFLAIYLSFPSFSYFSVQILFLLINGFFILPLLVETKETLKAQNKINYVNAITFLFTLMYSLSFIY